MKKAKYKIKSLSKPLETSSECHYLEHIADRPSTDNNAFVIKAKVLYHQRLVIIVLFIMFVITGEPDNQTILIY